MKPSNELMLIMSELALGSSFRIMEDYLMQKKHGWHCYWNPETPIKLATQFANKNKLIWC